MSGELASLGDYLEARAEASFQSGAASKQPDLDAAAASLTACGLATAAAVSERDAAVQALADYKAAHPDTPKSELIEFSDFAQQTSGLFLGDKSLVGKGVGVTTYQMKPHSSTQPAPPVQGSGKTNPLRLIRVGGNNSSQNYPGLEVGGFTLQGTDQGHLYGGLRIGYSTGANVHDVTINAIPGDAPGPPGETFSFELWQTTDAHVKNLTIDGAGVAATLMGNNFNRGTTRYDNVRIMRAVYGFSIALWQCPGAHVFTGCSFTKSRKHVNIEQSDGGTYDFNGCTFDKPAQADYVAQISSINASSKVTFFDPVWDYTKGPLKVRTFPTAPAPNNKQLDADIRCFIGGKDVTGDASKFQITHAG